MYHAESIASQFFYRSVLLGLLFLVWDFKTHRPFKVNLGVSLFIFHLEAYALLNLMSIELEKIGLQPELVQNKAYPC